MKKDPTPASTEVICVGTELLLGDIRNSNAHFLARQLALLGIPHYYQTVVGDNPERIKQVISIACERSNLLVFTGGLGPTPDDLTTETLADFFGAPLEFRPEIWADIQEKYAHSHRSLPESNRKQALLPRGAEMLPNPIGSAPGMIWQPRSGLTLLTFPGVPGEMQRMWTETAAPYLISRGWGRTTIVSRTLRFWGIGESALAEKVASFLELENPTVAPYGGKGEVRLRISAGAATREAALALIEPVETSLRAVAGPDCYGSDDDSLASVAGARLRSQGQSLAVAESCHGGDLGRMIAQEPESADYFRGGVIACDPALMIALMGVEPEILERFGEASPQVAEQMARGVKRRFQSDWGLSVTGTADLIYIGLVTPDGQTRIHSHRFATYRGREWIRHLSACSALDRLRRILSHGDVPDDFHS
ncbi:competence/damage-inducible protein A [Methylohalobius crimeensis]|uniref:competence/damage-inducible protein A n=1 Tax=Methylohalobius crimeensis TaxID=244365 RepID=UPI0003B39E1E|nr:competence/damage-inducible protein A [Methylohalobius crimeensis]